MGRKQWFCSVAAFLSANDDNDNDKRFIYFGLIKTRVITHEFDFFMCRQCPKESHTKWITNKL
jgi:hypothetical protein